MLLREKKSPFFPYKFLNPVASPVLVKFGDPGHSTKMSYSGVDTSRNKITFIYYIYLLST